MYGSREQSVPKACGKRWRKWKTVLQGEYMVVIYMALIIKGKRTYESVPATLKPQVKEMLIDLEQESLITE